MILSIKPVLRPTPVFASVYNRQDQGNRGLVAAADAAGNDKTADAELTVFLLFAFNDNLHIKISGNVLMGLYRQA